MAQAETYRIATYSAPLSRDGPGLLLRDLQKGDDPQLGAIAALIDLVAPDVLLLTDFDYDSDGLALGAFAGTLQTPFTYQFAARPNSGMATGLDLNGNGRRGEPDDAQGYGAFAGDGGMAILSRFPLGQVTDLSDTLWRDLPGATMPPMPVAAARAQRLSSTGHWIVRIDLPDQAIDLLAFSATPPVFDGPDDRNGLRNRDELRMWGAVLDGAFGAPPDSFVVAGNANLDPIGGDGLHAAMAAFLADPRLQDPLPAITTASWPQQDGPGDLRVSYVLPSRDWRIVDAGVSWPASDATSGDNRFSAGPHAIVWVEIGR